MALTKCPKCGNEVSDKAERCPNCNFELGKESEINICKECGAVLEEGMSACPKCGCPITESESKKNTAKMKKLIIAGLIAVVIIIIVAVVIHYRKTDQAQSYTETLELTSAAMLNVASEAESAGSLIHDVWYDTIFDENNADTLKYTSGHSDFNDSLQALFEDEEFSSTISQIESGTDAVQDMIPILNDPPAGYEDAHEAFQEYYDAYLELVNIVVNPTGSLQTFTEDFNEADTNFVKCYDALQIYLE